MVSDAHVIEGCNCSDRLKDMETGRGLLESSSGQPRLITRHGLGMR